MTYIQTKTSLIKTSLTLTPLTPLKTKPINRTKNP